MEPILVYGYPAGTSMGLVAALEWLGQPYKLSRVDMLGEMREPPYKRINQRVETPVLITDQGRPLTETMAIAAYLEARDTERRISFDPLSPEADRMHQLMGFLNTGFTGAFTPLWVALELPEPDPDFEAALRRFAPLWYQPSVRTECQRRSGVPIEVEVCQMRRNRRLRCSRVPIARPSCRSRSPLGLSSANRVTRSSRS